MSKDAKFCMGCGHPIILQNLYKILKNNNEDQKSVLGLDIGCSLLAWDFLQVNTFQTHHGRVTPTMVGFKRAKADALTFAYTGDGGAYSIGLQSLLWSAKRNDPVTVIVVNNSVYAMTGGQTAPTTMKNQITLTSPVGNSEEPIDGLALVRAVNKKAFVARTAVNNPKQLQEYLQKAIESQKEGNFAIVEVLSYCPTSWKTFGIGTNNFLEGLKNVFVMGEY